MNQIGSRSNEAWLDGREPWLTFEEAEDRSIKRQPTYSETFFFHSSNSYLCSLDGAGRINGKNFFLPHYTKAPGFKPTSVSEVALDLDLWRTLYRLIYSCSGLSVFVSVVLWFKIFILQYLFVFADTDQFGKVRFSGKNLMGVGLKPWITWSRANSAKLLVPGYLTSVYLSFWNKPWCKCKTFVKVTNL